MIEGNCLTATPLAWLSSRVRGSYGRFAVTDSPTQPKPLPACSQGRKSPVCASHRQRSLPIRPKFRRSPRRVLFAPARRSRRSRSRARSAMTAATIAPPAAPAMFTTSCRPHSSGTPSPAGATDAVVHVRVRAVAAQAGRAVSIEPAVPVGGRPARTLQVGGSAPAIAAVDVEAVRRSPGRAVVSWRAVPADDRHAPELAAERVEQLAAERPEVVARVHRDRRAVVAVELFGREVLTQPHPASPRSWPPRRRRQRVGVLGRESYVR